MGTTLGTATSCDDSTLSCYVLFHGTGHGRCGGLEPKRHSYRGNPGDRFGILGKLRVGRL